MENNNILLIKNDEVHALLAGRETEVIDAVRGAYQLHERQLSSLPHSLFLRFPDNPKNRIIALPAYLGGDFEIAGVKWIASFPENIDRGLERASAVIILNSPHTGQPLAIIEGSTISARRTAASATAAALALQTGPPHTRAALIGCGVINFEIVRFLKITCPAITELIIYDTIPARVAAFDAECQRTFCGLQVEVAPGPVAALKSARLISLATTAPVPHIFDLSACMPATTILHISLRDLAPEVILAHDNVVDDVDHVCRAQTSVHLAEQLTARRDFIRCTLGDILVGRAAARRAEHGITIFSPFGLGVLDMAVAKLVYDLAVAEGLGTVVDSFLPAVRLAKEKCA